jgi:hypothetical protein
MKFSLFTVTYAGLFYDGNTTNSKKQIIKPKNWDLDGLALETKDPLLHHLIFQKQTGSRTIKKNNF